MFFFTITDAGKASMWNASNTGLNFDITHIQLGGGNKTPAGNEAALLNSQEKVVLATGYKIGNNQVKMSAVFSGNYQYEVSEVGLWSGDPDLSSSTLFGYWSQPTGFLTVRSPLIDFVFTNHLTIDSILPSECLNVIYDSSQSTLLSIMANHELSIASHPHHLLKSNKPPLSEITTHIGTETRAWSVNDIISLVSTM